MSDTIIVNQPRLQNKTKATGSEKANETRIESTTVDDVSMEEQGEEIDEMSTKDVQILQIAIENQEEKATWM